MQVKTKKIVLIVLTFVWMLLLTACSAGRSLIKELPDEELVGVVRVSVDENGEETEFSLSEEKTSLFLDYLQDLEYQKKQNIFGIKSRTYDEVTYVMTYENYTVRLREHHLSILCNGEKEKEISFDSIQPSDAFDQIDKLFE